MTTLAHTRRGGFTLIELLASVGILVIIVTMVGVIFTESDRAWTLGTNRAENNLAGRAALNMIAHDLQYAVADDILTYVNRKDRKDMSTFGFDCDEVCFVSIQNDSSDPDPLDRRAAREIHYWVQEQPTNSHRYELRRGYFSSAILTAPASHSYHSKTWYEPPTLGGAGRPSANYFVAKNVVGFAVYAPDYDGTLTREFYSDAAIEIDGTNNSDRLPTFVDVCLELLNDREARQAAELWGRGPAWEVAAKEFVRNNAVRHVTRVHFHNRDGYKER